MAAGVNIVNAEVLLRDRGIEVIEQRNTDMGDFSSLITAEVVTSREDVDGRRHAVRQQHAAAGAEGQLPPGKLSGRRAADFCPSRPCRA